jgi:hypothetical protein
MEILGGHATQGLRVTLTCPVEDAVGDPQRSGIVELTAGDDPSGLGAAPYRGCVNTEPHTQSVGPRSDQAIATAVAAR